MPLAHPCPSVACQHTRKLNQGFDSSAVSTSLAVSISRWNHTGGICALLLAFLVLFLGVAMATAPLFFLPLSGMVKVLNIETYMRIHE